MSSTPGEIKQHLTNTRSSVNVVGPLQLIILMITAFTEQISFVHVQIRGGPDDTLMGEATFFSPVQTCFVAPNQKQNRFPLSGKGTSEVFSRI